MVTFKVLKTREGYILDNVTVAEGFGKLQEGQVLGRIDATGQYGPYDAAATDGRQTARVILAEDVDTSDGAKIVAVYVSGYFKKDALTGLDETAMSQLGARDTGEGIRVP